MKDHRNYKKWMIKASEVLSGNQMKVFTIWFDDTIAFSSGASRIAKDLPMMGRSNIGKALRGIAKKKLIKEDPSRAITNGKGKPTPFYQLNYEVLGLDNESKRTDNESESTHYPISNESESTHYLSHNELKRTDNESKPTHVLVNQLLNNTEQDNLRKLENELDNFFGAGLSREELLKDEFVLELWKRKEAGLNIRLKDLNYTKSDLKELANKFNQFKQQLPLDPERV